MASIKFPEERLMVLCDCHDIEHQFHFTFDPEEDDPEWDLMTLQIHLANKSFFSRLKYGIKYIFGYQCKYGAFDEVLIHPEDVEKIKQFLEKYSNRGKHVHNSGNQT